MRSCKKLSILSGLIMVFIIISSFTYSLPIAVIDEKIDVSHHLDYAEVTLNINSSNPLNRLLFNVSDFEDKIELAYAEVNGKIIGIGRVENDTLIMPLNTTVRNLVVKIFYSEIFQVNESNIITKVPVILSPIDLKSNVTFQILYPSSQVIILNVNASATGGILELNYSNVEPGTFKVITASLDPRLASVVKISKFTREIIIESSDQVQVIDTYEIEGLSLRKLEELAFLYPKYVKIVGVEGPLGPYPLGTSDIPFYSPTYRVYEFGDLLRVRVRLRSPPLNIGDRTYFSIKLSLPVSFSKDVLTLNPFFGVGYLISDYNILLKVRGKVALEYPVNLSLENIGKEDDFNVYMVSLKEDMPLLKSIVFPTLKLRTVLRGKLGPNYLLIALILALFGGIGAIVYHVRREEGVKEAKRRALEPIQRPEIYTISRNRVELMESILNSWNKMEDRKITHTTYRQTVSMALRRDGNLSKKFNELLSDIKEERIRSLVEKIERHISLFKNELRELEALSKEFRRGNLSKGEYKSRRNRIVNAMERELNEAYRTIEELREVSHG